MGTFLTHKELETMCDKFMSLAGWKRAKDKGEFKITRPDRVYLKKNEWPLTFEIKPENAEVGELKKGIGQAAGCLPYHVKPYLILSEQQWTTLKDIVIHLPWLGIIIYPNTTPQRVAVYTELKIKQKAEKRVDKEIIDIPFKPHKKQYWSDQEQLSGQTIYKFLLENRHWGHFHIDELKNLLIRNFPNKKITSLSLGYSLRELGFKKCTKKGILGFTIGFPITSVQKVHGTED